MLERDSELRLTAPTSDDPNDDPTWRYPFRAIETNEPMHWNGEWLDRVLAMMRSRGFNALVTHQNNLLDELTHLDDTDTEGVGDLRRKIVYGRVAWMRRLSSRLRSQSAKLYLEVKEPSFADYILAHYPETTEAGGVVNPLHPAWEEIVSRKVLQVIQALPELGGLIVSLSSPESRISPEGYARQRTDREYDFGMWLNRMVEAIRHPIASAGMELIVRDFTYGRERHDETIEILDQPRNSVAAAVKITPRDYFPCFPDNVAARRLLNVPVVFEFEAFGENTGWGVVPNCRVTEFSERMRFVEELGCRGLMLRINWEGVLGWSAIDGISDVNIHALSQLSRRGGATDPVAIVEGWLSDRYGTAPDSDAAARLARLLLDSFDCIKETYWHGNVFPRHSQIPLNWQQGWWSMRQHTLTDWSTDGAHDNDFDLSEDSRERLFSAKARAVRLASRLAAEAAVVLQSRNLPEPIRHELAPPFENLPVYMSAFDLATRGAFFAARFEAKGVSDDREAAHSISAEMSDLAEQYAARAAAASGTSAEHVAAVMFDPKHIVSFAASLSAL